MPLPAAALLLLAFSALRLDSAASLTFSVETLAAMPAQSCGESQQQLQRLLQHRLQVQLLSTARLGPRAGVQDGRASMRRLLRQQMSSQVGLCALAG